MNEHSYGATWYFTQHGAQQGPVDMATLQSMAAAGQLQSGDLVWRDGMAEWTTAGSVPDIFGGHAAPGGGYGVVPSAYAGPQQGYAGPVPIGYYTPSAQRPEYIGFWWRVLASIIDGVVTGIAGAIVGGVAGGIIGLTYGTDDRTVLFIQAISQLLGTLLNWLYSALMESSAQQATLGKMAIGVRVTDMAGQRISFGRATGRHFGKILSLLTLCIGYIMVGTTEKKQGLHDLMAGTLVVRGRPMK